MPDRPVERRLAAILNADAVGYTRLMADDEVATLETLNAHRTLMSGLVRQHGGRVVDMVGDNLLAEFPSAVDAVQCAVETQRQLAESNASLDDSRRMLFRIGLNVGDLIVDGERIVGDGVNVAARIQTIAEPGGIAISTTVLDQIEGKLPVRLRDLGAREFKNVRRPIRVYQVTTGETGDSAESMTEEEEGAVSRHVPGFGGMHAIAVLPFRNLSGEADQEYFADGLVEDLITSLAALRIYPVIARNSSFTYKDRTVDVRQAGQELGAHYMVTGSVRKAGSRMRINAELVDAVGAHQIWSGRYDREVSDIFEVQDEITLAIAGSVGPALSQSARDHAVRRTPKNLDAWECVHRSMWHLFQYTMEDTAQTHVWARRALKLEPDLATAYSLIAFSYMYEIVYQWSEDPDASRTQAARAADKAVALDKNDAMALTALGYAHSMMGEYDRSIAALERAIEVNPSWAMAYWALGASLAQSGRPDDAIPMIEMAIRLSPQDPLMHEFTFNIGAAHFTAGRYERALEFAHRSLNLRPGQPGALRLLTASHSFLGNTQEAAAALEKMQAAAPDLSEKHLRMLLPDEIACRYIEALRLAGWKGP
jgi:TolB-like protein/Tfp pilus assembly protein PilF